MAASQPIIAGTVFSRWTVIGPADPDSNGPRYLCRCECGTEKSVSARHLQKGRSKSCGCLRHEAIVAENNSRVKHGHAVGGRTSPEYGVWRSILWRCSPENKRDRPNYLGRGITVCERWQNSFEHFLADMGPRPSLLHSIDRIDNDGNYEPGNCRWASPQDQALNRRSNRELTHGGRTQSLSQWAEEIGISSDTLYHRLEFGWSVERALSESCRRKRKQGA